MANTMTLGEYFKEAEVYEYSKEYFDIVKESIEIDLLALYLENHEYMEECVEWGEEIHESISSMFMEDGNEEVKEETITGKARAFFEKIWSGIIKILKAIISPFTAFYTFLKKLFSKAEDDTKKTAEKMVKCLDTENEKSNKEENEKEKNDEERKATEEKKIDERIKADEEKFGEIAKWREKEKEKDANIQKKISEYIKSCKNGAFSEYYNFMIQNGLSFNIEMNSAYLHEPTFDKMIANEIKNKKDRDFVYLINRFYFSSSIIAPEVIHNMRKRLNDIAGILTELSIDMEECVNKYGKRYDIKSKDNEYITKHIRKIIEDIKSYNYTEKFCWGKHVIDDANSNLELVIKRMNEIYKDMQTYYQKMQDKKGTIFTKIDYTSYGKLFKLISDLQITLNDAFVKIRKEISTFYDFRRSMAQTLIELSLILRGYH